MKEHEPKRNLPENAILALGQPLLDIIAHVPQEVLDKFGLRVNNFCLADDSQRGVYEHLANEFNPQYIAGGCALNTARVAQWMSQDSPGATCFVGTIGKDAFGAKLREACGKDGVRGEFQLVDLPTGVCGVLVKDGERALCTRLDASKSCVRGIVEASEFAARIEECRVLYFTAFMLNILGGLESLKHVARLATERQKPVALNLAAPFLIEQLQSSLDDLLPWVDLVFCNETEAATLGATKGWGEELGEIALRLSAQPKASGVRSRVVVFTHGPEAVVVASNSQVLRFAVPPLDELEDTNGAGDAFVGGFLSRYAANKPLAECVRAGIYAARVVIQHSGCTFPRQPDFQ